MSCDTQKIAAVSVKRGDTLRILVELEDANGQPIDASGWAWLCQVRDALEALVTTMSIDTTDAAIGVIWLGIDDDVTETMAVADYVFDLQATDEADDTLTLVDGQLRVKADVSMEVMP